MGKKQPKGGLPNGGGSPGGPTPRELAKRLEFWHGIRDNEALSAGLLKLSKDDVLAEVIDSNEDLELVQLGLESLELRSERGASEWVVGKLPDNALKIVVPPSQGKDDMAAEALALAAKIETTAAAVFAAAGVPDLNVCYLTKLSDGVFISGQTSKALGYQKIDFVAFNEHNGIFNVIRNENLDELIQKEIPPPLRYTADKLNIRFLDTLTYPQPARKFTVLLAPTVLVSFVRQMILADLEMDAADDLVLMTRGKVIPRSSDKKSLAELGFKEKQQIVLSIAIGKVLPSPSRAEGGLSLDLMLSPLSVVERGNEKGLSALSAFRVSHAYQVLGGVLERLILTRFSQAFAKEEGARRSEEELYALLEEENREKSAEEEKKRKKKEKKKQEKAKPSVSEGAGGEPEQGAADSVQKGKRGDEEEEEDEDDEDVVPSLNQAATSAATQAKKNQQQPQQPSPQVSAQKGGKNGGKDSGKGGGKQTEEEQLRMAMALSLRAQQSAGGRGGAAATPQTGEPDAEEIRVSSKKQKKAEAKKQEKQPPPSAQTQTSKATAAPAASPSANKASATKTGPPAVKATPPPAPVPAPAATIKPAGVLPTSFAGAVAPKPPGVAPLPPTPTNTAAAVAAASAASAAVAAAAAAAVKSAPMSVQSRHPGQGFENILGLLGTTDAPPGFYANTASAQSAIGVQALGGNFAAMGLQAGAMGAKGFPHPGGVGVTGPAATAAAAASVASAAAATVPRFCSGCGSRLSGGRFCGNCGRPIDPVVPVAPVVPVLPAQPIFLPAQASSFGNWDSTSLSRPQPAQASGGILGGLGLGVRGSGFGQSAMSLGTASTQSLGLGGMDPTKPPVSPLGSLLNTGLGGSNGGMWAPPPQQMNASSSAETQDNFSFQLENSVLKDFLGGGYDDAGADSGGGGVGPFASSSLGFGKDYGLSESELLPTAQPFIPGTSNSARQLLRGPPPKVPERDRGRRDVHQKHSNNSRNFEGWK